jgi:hypothetical protein
MTGIFGFLLWLGFCAAVATAANTRGRSPIGWFLLAFFITPLLAGCFLLALPKIDPKPESLESPELRERVNRWGTP